MTTTKTHNPRFLQRRKFFVALPLLVLPFLFLAFYALGGGKEDEEDKRKTGGGMGFNMELPSAVFDTKDAKMDKMAYYKRADADSIKRKELLQQDPYHRKDTRALSMIPVKPVADTQADALLRRLDLLKRQMDGTEKPQAGVQQTVRVDHRSPVGPSDHRTMVVPAREFIKHPVDTPIVDPELEKLNSMLDKIARLQQGKQPEEEIVKTHIIKEEQASMAAAPAVVEADQELISGAAIALRLTAAVLYNGLPIPKGQLVYGVVAINNDRMQVTIQSIRCGQSIVSTAWQVYDMDGLQGIRVPDGLNRQVARQSADQGIGALNLSTYDPSIGAQVTNAGIQTARNLFSRKVRTIRVMVPAGYHVLLRDTKMAGAAGGLRILPDTTDMRMDDSAGHCIAILPPAVGSLEPFLHASTSEGKVSLTLRGLYQREGVLWLYLVLKNRSAFSFSPDHLQCSIRQGRHLKRMAVQELPVELVYDSLPAIIGSGSEQVIMVGMKPLSLSKDKQLVVQMGEQSRGEVLALKIDSRTLSKIR